MAIVTAKLKSHGKDFALKVDLDEALKVQQGQGDINSAVQSPSIYKDINRGTIVSDSDLKTAFGTTDLYEAAKQIIEKGEVQKTQDFRDAEREQKIKQVVDLILRNAVDQHGNPYTEERIKRAMEEAHVNIDNKPAEQQVSGVIGKLKEIIPIKVETKKVKLTIPAQYTGQVYGIINDFKESEEWLPNGSLQAILNIPSGMQMDFYEKVNNVAHGAIQSEDIPEVKD